MFTWINWYHVKFYNPYSRLNQLPLWEKCTYPFVNFKAFLFRTITNSVWVYHRYQQIQIEGKGELTRIKLLCICNIKVTLNMYFSFCQDRLFLSHPYPNHMLNIDNWQLTSFTIGHKMHSLMLIEELIMYQYLIPDNIGNDISQDNIDSKLHWNVCGSELISPTLHSQKYWTIIENVCMEVKVIITFEVHLVNQQPKSTINNSTPRLSHQQLRIAQLVERWTVENTFTMVGFRYPSVTGSIPVSETFYLMPWVHF